MKFTFQTDIRGHEWNVGEGPIAATRHCCERKKKDRLAAAFPKLNLVDVGATDATVQIIET
jgi:hypothetical protein